MQYHHSPRRRMIAIAVTSLAVGLASQAAPVSVPPPTPAMPVVPAAPPAVAPTGPVTVDAAVALALRNNPSITRSEQDLAIAEAQVRSARAGRMPSVNVGVNSTYNPSPATITLPGGGPGFSLGQKLSTSATVTGTVPVWPPERWRAPISSAEANLGSQEEALRRTRQQTAFLVRQAFYQLVGAQELLQVSQSAVTVAQTQLQLAQNTVDAGVAAPLDIFQARATLEDARVGLVKAQNAVDLARANLAVQMGLPASTPVQIVPPAELPTAPVDVDALVATAVQQRPELTQLIYRRQQVEANIETLRLRQRPSVNLQASYTKDLDGGFTLGASGLTFGASVAMNVYNGGQTDADVQAARIQLEQVQTSINQLELNIGLDVRQAWMNLQNALQQLTSAQEQQTAAREALRISGLRYREGEGIILEVQQAQLRLTQADTALAQARLQALTAAAQLEFAMGTNAPTVAAVPPTPPTPPVTPPAAG